MGEQAMSETETLGGLPTKKWTVTKSEVYCKVTLEAIHNWPGVVNIPGLEEVHYLQYPHRHQFVIRAYSRVTHSDRDVEFIWLAHQIEKFIKAQFPTFNGHALDIGSTSCEMLGELVLNNFPQVYKVDVSEDDENGAVMERQEWVGLDLDSDEPRVVPFAETN